MGHYQSDSCCKTSRFHCARTMTMHWTARADSDLHWEHESLTSVSASNHKSYQQRKGEETRNPSLHTASQCSRCSQLASWHFLLGIFAARKFLLSANNVWGLSAKADGIQLTDTRRQLARRAVAFLSSSRHWVVMVVSDVWRTRLLLYSALRVQCHCGRIIWLSWCWQPFKGLRSSSIAQLTIRYDTMIFTCAQKLTWSQLNLPHGTKQKRIMKKLKIKTEMLRRNGPVIKPWSQFWGRKGVYGGKDLWKR